MYNQDMNNNNHDDLITLQSEWFSDLYVLFKKFENDPSSCNWDLLSGYMSSIPFITNKLINRKYGPASLLGSIKSEKKAKSSAENGKKGGRPKKIRAII